MSNNETLADILAEMRDFAEHRDYDSDGNMSTTILRVFADRIEAAAVREIRAERTEAIDEALAHAEEVRAEKCRNCERAPGNASAMRKALEGVLSALADAGFHPYVYGDPLAEAVIKARSALSATPRNCDVGTAEEQWDRFSKHCRSHDFCSHCPVKPLWNFEKGRKPSCGLLWAQMPYTSEGGKE